MAMAWAETGAYRAIVRALGDLLSPLACAACDEPLEASALALERAFCDRCELALSECDPAECATCGLPAPEHGLCRSCRVRLRPLTAAHCTFLYEGPLADALHRLKYRGRDELMGRVAERWAATLPLPRNLLLDRPLIVPVPLHPRRLRERGFDQAWILARALARRTGLEAASRLLMRVRDTRAQVGLGREERQANVAGAFAADPRVAGRTVLLVDDVLTTGATLHAAAEALGAAGAGPIVALTAARALE
jgi:ComF family protein